MTPALALIEKLEGKSQVVFIGRKYSMEGVKNPSAEYRLISQKSIKFIAITAGRLQRKFTRYTIPSLAKIPLGILQAFYNLLRVRPSVVVSFGGYLSTPVVISAWLLGIDCIVHEQATVPGLANRINTLFAKKVFVTWRQSQKYFSVQTRVVGNLTRNAIKKTEAKNTRIREFLKKSKKLIFITGGNQGSHFLNLKTFELLPHLEKFLIVHQVGTTNYEGDLDRAQRIENVNYLAVDYLDSDNIGAVLNRADLVIARSGANTVWDLAILAKVAVLIPLPISASGEQEENSAILEKAGSAIVIQQQNASTQKILEAISLLSNQSFAYSQKAVQFSKTLPKNASDTIAKILLESP